MHSDFSSQRLKAAGLRPTRDRHRLLELFVKDRAWTAEQIHTELPEMDLSTVYRNLHHLQGAGLIVQTHSHDGKQHFERAGEDHHDHWVCKTCDVLECIPCPIPKQTTHHLELLGVCRSCK